MQATLEREGPIPDPRWQEELDLIAPPGGRLSWLHLYWEPGDTWEPIHRWFVGQVVPQPNIPPMYLEWFEGPNPRTMGYLDREHNQWISFAPPISKRQWEYYQKTKCLLIPHWVIQGTEGGHKYRFNSVEQKILKLKGKDPTPWAPGDLPYAAPDERTFKKLLEADLMRRFQYTTNYLENTEQRLKDDERALLVEMRERVWNWLGEQVREPSSKIAHLQRKNEFPDLPKSDPLLDKKHEELEEQFITGE